MLKKQTKTLAISLSLILVGCAVHDGSSPWSRIDGAHAPTYSAPYGVMVSETLNSLESNKARMRQLCAPFGGLNESSIVAQSARFGENKWSYSCYGTRSSPPSLEPQSTSTAPQKTNNITIDVAKQKCQELGFKSGTEGFGKCVLQLSK